MTNPVAPTDLPTGSTGTVAVRMQPGGEMQILDATGVVVGTLTLAKDGTITGSTDPAALAVTPVAIAVAVGDVLMEQTTGDTRVVRWVGDDGTSWASGQSTRPQFTTDGWVKVGTATLT